MRRKKNEEYRESQVTTINIFDFTFYLLYFARKHSLKKVVNTGVREVPSRKYFRKSMWQENSFSHPVKGTGFMFFGMCITKI